MYPRPHTLNAAKLALALILCTLGMALKADEPPLRMVYDDFPPYSFTDADGNAAGLSIDLLEILARSAGYDLVFLAAANPSESLRMIQEGKADVSALLALTQARQEIALPTLQLGQYELQAYTHRSSAARTMSDLSGLKIGAVKGSYGINGAQQIPDAQIIEQRQMDEMIVSLLAGEIDAFVSPRNSLLARLRKADLEQQIRPIGPSITSSPYGFFVSDQRRDVQQALNTAIETALSADDLTRLQTKWFGKSKTLLDRPQFWWSFGIGLSALLVLLFVSLRSLRHKRAAETLLRKSSGNTLLIKALDEIAAAIVIYDKDMNVIHWNKGTEHTFPALVEILSQGTTMTGLLRYSYANRAPCDEINEDEIDDAIAAHIANSRAGRTSVRTVYTVDNRVFEAREFKLGDENYASIRVDVTRLQQQQDVIQDQSQKLQDANAQLSSFAAIAAHDLRAPLNQLTAMMSFIDEDLEDAQVALPDEVKTHWELMKSRIERMQQLIQDLLNFANTDVEDQDIKPISPTHHILNVKDFIGAKEGFVIDVADNMPTVLVNEIAFETVMRNLISNAIKHHDKPSGTITVESHLDGTHAVISVRDDGPGIPEKYWDKIFEPFQRLTSTTEGSGLGLAYIRTAVERWGGSISVENAVPRGSIFSVTVPLANGSDLPIKAAE